MAGKIDFKLKIVTRDKEDHYIMINGSIHQEDVTVVKYPPNTGVPEYIKQIPTELKRKINSK